MSEEEHLYWEQKVETQLRVKLHVEVSWKHTATVTLESRHPRELASHFLPIMQKMSNEIRDMVMSKAHYNAKQAKAVDPMLRTLVMLAFSSHEGARDDRIRAAQEELGVQFKENDFPWIGSRAPAPTGEARVQCEIAELAELAAPFRYACIVSEGVMNDIDDDIVAAAGQMSTEERMARDVLMMFKGAVDRAD